MTLDLLVELEPEGYSFSDGELAYEDGDDFYDGDDDFDGHQYFYEGDENDRDDRGRDNFDGYQYFYEGDRDDRGEGLGPTNGDGIQSDSDVEILGCRRPGKVLVVEEPQGDGVVTTDSNESSSDTEMEETREINPNQRYVGEDSSDS